jgi:hypothetical protein
VGNEDGGGPPDPLAEASLGLARMVSASVQGRIALGPRAGTPVRRIGQESGTVRSRGPRQAHLEGFDLHANVRVPAHDRARREQLCRYVLRPPIAKDRLRLTKEGRLVGKACGPDTAPWDQSDHLPRRAGSAFPLAGAGGRVSGRRRWGRGRRRVRWGCAKQGGRGEAAALDVGSFDAAGVRPGRPGMPALCGPPAPDRHRGGARRRAQDPGPSRALALLRHSRTRSPRIRGIPRRRATKCS